MSAASLEDKVMTLAEMFPTIYPEEIKTTLIAVQGSVERAIECLLDPSKAPRKRKIKADIRAFFQTSTSDKETPPKMYRMDTTLPKEFMHEDKQMQMAAFKAWDPSKEAQKPILLTQHTLEKHIPCLALQTNFLPQEQANQVLEEMLESSSDWIRTKWVIVEREVESPHETQVYGLDETQLRQKEDLYANSGTAALRMKLFTPLLQTIKTPIDMAVNEALSRRERHPLEAKGPWAANLVLGNLYKTPEQSVGSHSDTMTELGPRPTIASFTLGAERTFRIKRLATETSPAQTFNLRLPHNSLLIMFPPFQEFYRHEVPPQQPWQVKAHAIARDARVNLTFRMVRQNYMENIPRCHCKKPAVLRTANRHSKSNVGEYFYMCAGSVPASCSYFCWLKNRMHLLEGKPNPLPNFEDSVDINNGVAWDESSFAQKQPIVLMVRSQALSVSYLQRKCGDTLSFLQMSKESRIPLKYGDPNMERLAVRGFSRRTVILGGILLLLNIIALGIILVVTVTTNNSLVNVHDVVLKQPLQSSESFVNLPSKFGVRNVTPRRIQGERGTCWDFATVGLLEWSYRNNGLSNQWLDDDEYVAFSEQAYGIEIMKLCQGPPNSKQQILCHEPGDQVWNNSTEGGEVYLLYYLKDGLKHALLPHAVCPYIDNKKHEHICPGFDSAIKSNPVQFDVKDMQTFYDIPSIKARLATKKQAMAVATAEVNVMRYHPCVGQFLNSTHCQLETCTLCPPDMPMTTCCVPMLDDNNPNMHGEYYAHSRMVFDDGHAMLLVGYNDAFRNQAGEVGGFIVKNSYAQTWDAGSHSMAWWLQEISEWEERTLCPNSYNPFNWWSCGTQKPFSQIEVHDTFEDCLSEKTQLEAKLSAQPLELDCIDDTVCANDPAITYYLRNTTIWDDTMTLRCFWEYNSTSGAVRDFCYMPMLEQTLSKILIPRSPFPNNQDVCGFNFLSYEAVRQYSSLFGLFHALSFEIEWHPSSYLANKDQFKSFNYSLLQKSTGRQRVPKFKGPHPHAQVVSTP